MTTYTVSPTDGAECQILGNDGRVIQSWPAHHSGTSITCLASDAPSPMLRVPWHDLGLALLVVVVVVGMSVWWKAQS